MNDKVTRRQGDEVPSFEPLKTGIEEISVSELCEKIVEAPAYDAEIGLTAEQMGRAYERLRLVAVELAGWVNGTDGGTESPAPCGEKGGRE